MSGAPQLPLLGDELGGRYVLIQRLAVGTGATVFRARDRHSKIHVALKLLAAVALGDAERERRLLDEGRCLERLRGTPGVVALIDHGRFGARDDWPYLATALLEGQTLSARLRERRFTGRELRELCVATAKAIAACHAKGVVLGELAPAKLSLTLDPIRVELFDFSHATIHVAVGHVPVAASGDVFSFGALLYELITGRPPNPSSVPGEARGLALEAWAHEVHSEWSELLADCAEADPGRRPDMLELVDRLEHIPLHSDEGESTDRVTFSEIQARASSDYPRAPSSMENQPTRRIPTSTDENGPTRVRERPPQHEAVHEDDEPTRLRPRISPAEASPDDDEPTRLMPRISTAGASAGTSLDDDEPTRLMPRTSGASAGTSPDEDEPTRLMPRISGASASTSPDEDEPTRLMPRISGASAGTSPEEDEPTRLRPRVSVPGTSPDDEASTQVRPRVPTPQQSRLPTAPMPAIATLDIPVARQSEELTERVPVAEEQHHAAAAQDNTAAPALRASAPLAPRAGELRVGSEAPRVHVASSSPAANSPKPPLEQVEHAQPRTWMLPLLLVLCLTLGALVLFIVLR